MKVSEFNKIIEETPIYMARFKLIKVPTWLKLESNNYLNKQEHLKGDYYLYDNHEIMIPVNEGLVLSPFATMFKFVDYVKVKQIGERKYKIVE